VLTGVLVVLAVAGGFGLAAWAGPGISPVGRFTGKASSSAASDRSDGAVARSFTVTAAQSAQTVVPGSTAVYAVSITRARGFTGPVELAPYGRWPAGISASVSPRSVTGTTSTLRVTSAAAGTPAGSYPVYLVGSSSVHGRTAHQYVQIQVAVAGGGKSFSISGGGVSGLAPGVLDQPLDLSLSNPGTRTISVTNLSVTVTGTSAGAACGPENFSVTPYSGAYPLYLPARTSGVPLSSLAVAPGRMPQLRMLDLPVNQDGCKGVRVRLSYSGSARGN
jgi:hypothetical protein